MSTFLSAGLGGRVSLGAGSPSAPDQDFCVFGEGHAEEVRYFAGGAEALFFVEPPSAFKRRGGVEGDERTAASLELLLSGLEELIGDTPPLPTWSHRHAAQMPLPIADGPAGQSPNHLACLVHCDPDGHGGHALSERGLGQHRVQEGLGRIGRLERRKRRPQALEDTSPILGPCPSDAELDATLIELWSRPSLRRAHAAIALDILDEVK